MFDQRLPFQFFYFGPMGLNITQHVDSWPLHIPRALLRLHSTHPTRCSPFLNPFTCFDTCQQHTEATVSDTTSVRVKDCFNSPIPVEELNTDISKNTNCKTCVSDSLRGITSLKLSVKTHWLLHMTTAELWLQRKNKVIWGPKDNDPMKMYALSCFLALQKI